MSRLVWNETLDGWFGGNYQIELAAPQLWVLSRRVRRGHRPPATELVRTGGSLTQLKDAADEMERRRLMRRRLLTRLWTIAILGFLAAGAFAAGLTVLAVPALGGVFVAGLRTLVIWVDEATGAAWSVVSHHSQ